MNEKLSPEHYLYLENGAVIKNIQDLLIVIKKLDKKTFFHHVNNLKNDFAYWVKSVIGNKKLANRMFRTKDKKELVEILKNECK